MSSESNKIISNDEIIAETKHDLIEYYDLVKSQIDITCQKLFLNMNTFFNQDDDDNQEEDIDLVKSKLARMNLEYIRIVDEICDQNMLDLTNNHENNLNKEILKKKLLTKYCIYIVNDELNTTNKALFPIGTLICSDYYFSSDENNYIKSFFKHNSKKVEKDELVTIKVDKNLMNLIGSFQNFEESSIDLNSFRVIRIEKDAIQRYVSTLKEIEINAAPYNSLIEIGYIKEDSFHDFSQLEKIKIDASSLRPSTDQTFQLKIERMTFYNLSNLRKIHFYDLKYDILDSKSVFALENLSNLKKISLSNCKIDIIKADTFQNLTSLNHLKLFNLRINSIETGFFQSMKNLDKLELRFNRIKQPTSDLFHNMNSVTKLRLRSNPIGDKIDYKFNLKDDLINQFSNLKQLELDFLTFKCYKSVQFANADQIDELGIVFNLGPNQEQTVHVMMLIYFIQSLKSEYFQNMPNLKRIVFKFDGCPDEMFQILKEKLNEGLKSDETMRHISIEAMYSTITELAPAYLSNHTSKCRFKSS